MAEKSYYVYILASRKNGTMYIGVTDNLSRRMHEHKTTPQGFVAQYKLSLLVYAESFSSIEEAIHRESTLKNWKRIWKLKLIEDNNPEWHDLTPTLI